MRRNLIVILISTLILLPPLLADEVGFKIERGDTTVSVLQKQIDQRVTLILSSGTEITGTVRSVGYDVVHLSELAGKDFYDAVVDLKAITAVVVRVRGTNQS